MSQLSAEQSLICAILGDASILDDAVEKISAEDFSNLELARIFDTMSRLQKNGEPVDVISVVDKCKDISSTVLDIVTNGHPFRPMSCIGVIRRESDKRHALNRLQAAYEAVSQGSDFYSDISSASSILSDIERDELEQQSFKELCKSAIDRLDDRMLNGSSGGLLTGFKDIDARFSGIAPTDLVIIAARPSMGKTAFAMNIAAHAATEDAVIVFSMEMSREQLMDRLLSAVSGVHIGKIKSGKLSDEDWHYLGVAGQKLIKMNLIINDTAAMDIYHMGAIARKISRKQKVGAIVVDYLQLATCKTESRFESISTISRQLKVMAKTVEAPVFALSQLNRKCDERTNKRPTNADLRESGQIEQDADIIMMLYRDEVYNEDTYDKGVLEVITTKYRDGEAGTDRLVSELYRSRFVDMPEGYQQPKPNSPPPKKPYSYRKAK